MSDSTGHYLKPAKRVTTPAVVFGIAVESERMTVPGSTQYAEKVFRKVACCVSKKRNGKWSLPKTIETADCNALRQWMMKSADCKRRNYVIAPIASDVLTLTGWWDYAKQQGITFVGAHDDSKQRDNLVSEALGIGVRRCILRGTPDIFDYSEQGKRFIWLSGCQYLNAPEADIAEAIGFKADDGLFGSFRNNQSDLSTLERSVLWSQVLMHLANWWSENSKAPFGFTLGGLAMGILRTHTKPKSLSTHADEYTHKLERIACYGGRASVWYVGSIGNAPTIPIHWESNSGQRDYPRLVGPARLIDVRSMHPYLLRERLFPTRYAGRIGNVPPEELQSLALHYGTIASVTIYSHSGEYARRTEERITYPRGYFQTVLTGPEILSIVGKDKIVKVHDGALYYLDRPYQKAAEALLDMRINARTQKKGVWEMFAKSVGNNLGGKLAQKRAIWKAAPDVPAQREWGEWIASFPEEERAIRYRAIQGLVFEYVKDEGGYGPYTASFAYLTAYGRLHMRKIRETCPPETVLSQDTDGIWVLGDKAYDILRDTFAFGDGPGELAIKEITTSCVFLDARHYYTDKGWTLAGFHNPTMNVDRLEVTDEYSINPATIGTRSVPRTILTKSRSSLLTLDYGIGEITPDGWVIGSYIDPPEDYQF